MKHIKEKFLIFFWKSFVQETSLQREREKVDLYSGPVAGRRVSVRAVTGVPQTTFKAFDPRFAVVSSLLRLAWALEEGRPWRIWFWCKGAVVVRKAWWSSLCGYLVLSPGGGGSVSSVDAGSCPREVEATFSSAVVGLDYGGEGVSCLASPSAGSLAPFLRV